MNTFDKNLPNLPQLPKNIPWSQIAYTLGARAQNWVADQQKDQPSFVVIDLQGAYPSVPSQNPLEALLKRQESLESFKLKLQSLAQAPWLKAVVFRLGELDANWATLYSLRQAISELSATKTSYAFAEQLDMRSYYLLSACSEIAVPESAMFDLNGLKMSQIYWYQLLQNVGIQFAKLSVGEYKSALSNLSEPEMSAFDREQRTTLLEGIEQEFCQAVAQSRNCSPEQVKTWLAEGITSAEQAHSLGLIDRIDYEDALLSRAHVPLAQAQHLLKLPLYSGQQHVAIVALEGNIVSGKSQRASLMGANAGSSSIVRGLRAAERDPNAAAIVFYVNSGGGSALASDLIWREVSRIGRKKPIVAVMGQVAASGGYYVLTHAQHVIAAPQTITGSIGVVMAKPVLEAFNKKYGLHTETVKTQEFADFMTPSRNFSEAEREVLERSMNEIYQRFVQRVADGRNLSTETVHNLGRGRIWSGVDALAQGLVDELGDLDSGIRKAKALAGLPADAPHQWIETPKQSLMPDIEKPAAWLSNGWARDKVLLLSPIGLQLT